MTATAHVPAYIVSAFGLQGLATYTSKQGAVGAGAKNSQHHPATFLFEVVRY